MSKHKYSLMGHINESVLDNDDDFLSDFQFLTFFEHRKFTN